MEQYMRHSRRVPDSPRLPHCTGGWLAGSSTVGRDWQPAKCVYIMGGLPEHPRKSRPEPRLMLLI